MKVITKTEILRRMLDIKANLNNERVHLDGIKSSIEYLIRNI